MHFCENPRSVATIDDAGRNLGHLRILMDVNAKDAGGFILKIKNNGIAILIDKLLKYVGTRPLQREHLVTA